MNVDLLLTRGERLLLQELRDHGPLSPGEVRECGFSLATGPKACHLKERGLVAEVGKVGTAGLRYEITQLGRQVLAPKRAAEKIGANDWADMAALGVGKRLGARFPVLLTGVVLDEIAVELREVRRQDAEVCASTAAQLEGSKDQNNTNRKHAGFGARECEQRIREAK